MPFSYYNKLNAKEKQVYRISQTVALPRIPDNYRLGFIVSSIKDSLRKEERERVEFFCEKLLINLCEIMGVPFVKVKILRERPANSYGELHGIYYPQRGILPAMIMVWMRTSKRKKVVAPRTFMRTLLHEFCHHLDYELYKLPYSFHTEGFYRRESDLLYQIMGE